MNVTITFPAAPTPPPEPVRVTGWRGLHPDEGGRVPDQTLNSPEVIPPFNPTVGLSMTRAIQLMSYDLMSHFHPAVKADPNKWRITHGYRYAMNNGTGFDEPGDPRVDYVNGRDLFAELPKYDKDQRTFAGSLITGRLEGNVIWCEPGVDSIDARNFSYTPGTPEATETLKQIIEKRWYSYAVADGDHGPFRMGGHWGAGFVVFPFILNQSVSYESRFFVPWDETFAPDPLKVYKPI